VDPEPVRTTWRRENSCPCPDSNSDSPAVHHVASSYADCAVPAPLYIYTQLHGVDTAQSYRDGTRAGRLRLEIQQGKAYLSSTASRPPLGPTQPPIQWVPGPLSLGVNGLGREAVHSPLCSTEVEMVELYLHSSTCLHGVVLNYALGQMYLYIMSPK
jgi:hypothetical protein